MKRKKEKKKDTAICILHVGWPQSQLSVPLCFDQGLESNNNNAEEARRLGTMVSIVPASVGFRTMFITFVQGTNVT